MESYHEIALDQLVEHLIDQARSAAGRAVSYRNFRVGCAILAWTPTPRTLADSYRVFLGANMKANPNTPKVCAEMTALGGAIAEGYTRILGICVAGIPQPDADSGVESATLHPCSVCRTYLATIPQVAADTRVFTVHNGSGVIEHHTVATLLALHSGVRAECKASEPPANSDNGS